MFLNRVFTNAFYINSNVSSNNFLIVVRFSDRTKQKAKKWDKDQVRITLSCPFETGFLGYARSVMNGRELRPELLLRVEFIEGYVEFLKVGVSSCVSLTCSDFHCVVRCVI